MKKKIIALLLSAVVILSALGAAVFALADNATSWSYDAESKTLTISGQGDMENYDDEFSAPWLRYIKQIENVVICNGVTSIGAYAFSGADSLLDVAIPDSVTAVNEYAFSSCSALDRLYFSPCILHIADTSFVYNGLEKKSDFMLSCEAGSYALNYAFKNGIDFDCSSIKCGDETANVVVRGMTVYYPYTARVSGTFEFSSYGAHDTYGYLYDENQNLLASNDDATYSDTNFKITYDLTKGERYYFAARIYNTSLVGSFSVKLEAVDYYVSGGVYAMLNRQGECSNMLLGNAVVNGTSGGTYSLHITEPTVLQYSFGGRAYEYEITADKGDVQNIAVMVCDVNNDGIVNGKDAVIMYKAGSPYYQLFQNFINYRY